MDDLLRFQFNRPKINIYNLFVYVFFLISCIHTVALVSWLILMPIISIYKYKKVGAIEFFLFLQFRSLLSSGVASQFDGIAGLMKWVVVFLISSYLIICKLKLDKRINNIIVWVLLFSISSFLFAWISSSYPVTASFKVLSYCIPFIAIIIGLSETSDIEWIKKINSLFEITLLVSVFLMPFSVGYLRNGHAFQGVFNHPNILGVMISIFIAGYLYKEQNITLKTIFISVLSIFLLYKTESRTGMISLLLVLFLFLITHKIELKYKIIFVLIILLCFCGYIFSGDLIVNLIVGYLHKGSAANVLASRIGQFSSNINRFTSSPIFGTGFNVPYIQNYRSFGFSFNLITENGNLFLALLGDVGILGFLIFVITYFMIFKAGNKRNITLFIVPFLVCMGEMAFFSTNNFGIILYFFFGIYIVDGKKAPSYIEEKVSI